jgi:hypothetical protein
MFSLWWDRKRLRGLSSSVRNPDVVRVGMPSGVLLVHAES